MVATFDVGLCAGMGFIDAVVFTYRFIAVMANGCILVFVGFLHLEPGVKHKVANAVVPSANAHETEVAVINQSGSHILTHRGKAALLYFHGFHAG